ncbi:MAG: ABC transporter, ATP-binding protein (cluster 5, nickel/peptides/opines), partial [uncultured Thermomicrobiales bacterium]
GTPPRGAQCEQGLQRGPLQPRAEHRARRLLLRAGGRAAIDHRRGGRERQRQDDPGAPAPRAGGTDQRQRALQRERPPQTLPRGVAHVHPGGPGHLPGPLRGLQPLLHGRSRAQGADQEVRAGRDEGAGPRADGGGAHGGGAAPGGDAGAPPAPVERRAAAADHGGARAPPQAPRDHRRRAGLDGRRLPPRHHPQQPAPNQPPVRHLDPLHHARPDDGVPAQREYHRPLSRGGGGGRQRRARRPAPPAPLHPVAGRVGPAPRPPPTLGGSPGPLGARPGDDRRELPVRRPLPERDARLHRGPPAALSDQPRSGGGLLPLRRCTGDGDRRHQPGLRGRGCGL